LSIVEFVIVESLIVQFVNVELEIVELSTVHETILEHCLTVDSSMEELSVTDELSETVEETLIVELSAVYKSLEGQLTEVSDELDSVGVAVVELLPDDEPDPPPLQEITRRLK